MLPTLNDLRGSRTAPRQRPKFSDRVAVTGDNYAFASLNPIEHLSPVIAKFAHRHDIHLLSASPVRRSWHSACLANRSRSRDGSRVVNPQVARFALSIRSRELRHVSFANSV